MGQRDLMEADLEGWSELVNWHMGQTLQGGSQVAAVSLSPLGVPVVFANVWMRPFFWEAHNLTAAATGNPGRRPLAARETNRT